MGYQKPYPLPYASGDRKQGSFKDFLLDVLDGHARIHRMLLQIAGPDPEDTGIIKFGGLGETTGLVEEESSPIMGVKFNPAIGFVNQSPFLILEVTHSGAVFTAPSGDDRIDVIYIDPDTQSYEISTGVEDPSPVPNTIDETLYAKVAEIYLTPAHTSIQNEDITPAQNFYAGTFPPTIPPTYGTIYIPGGYMIPSNDAAPSDGLETANYGTNALSYQVFDFSTSQIAMFEFVLPLDFDNNFPVNFRLNWSADDATTDPIDFDLFIIPASESVLLSNTTVNGTASVTDNNGGTADQRRVTPFSGDITLGLAAGDDCIAKLQYSNSTGNIGANIRVHSVTIRYTKKVS